VDRACVGVAGRAASILIVWVFGAPKCATRGATRFIAHTECRSRRALAAIAIHTAFGIVEAGGPEVATGKLMFFCSSQHSMHSSLSSY
jgi:hypothetical protein